MASCNKTWIIDFLNKLTCNHVLDALLSISPWKSSYCNCPEHHQAVVEVLGGLLTHWDGAVRTGTGEGEELEADVVGSHGPEEGVEEVVESSDLGAGSSRLSL